MKFVILTVVIFVVSVNANEQVQAAPKTRREFFNQCKAEAGLTRDVASKIGQGKFENDTDTHKAQCFIKCYFKLSGYMDQNGQVQKDVMTKKISTRYTIKEADVVSVIDECTKTKGKDDCEVAHDLFKCYRTKLAPQINAHTKNSLKPKVAQSNSSTSAPTTTANTASSSTKASH